MPTKTTTPRISFNSGFHDGRDDRAKGRPIRERGRTVVGALGPLPSFDEAYCRGYVAGSRLSLEDAADVNLRSDDAWAADRAEAREKAAARKAQREARPDPYVRRY